MVPHNVTTSRNQSDCLYKSAQTEQKYDGLIESAALQRAAGAACYLLNLIHAVNKLQRQVSGQVPQIRSESPSWQPANLQPASQRAKKPLRSNIPPTVI